ncbi:MAG: NADH-quinone oxidoreductase subunit N [Gemmatimonadetes bacterium]|jgi:NADH-quinone oxidoreductase subunit N|nr:NADH-quinone oxidoreductase subunit N [Gemmatimonadota bacterium]
MNYELANPSQLMQAFAPDLLLMGGAMVLMLWAAWRPESNEHQRAVGKASLALIAATIGMTLWYSTRGLSSSLGVIAVDNFRWATDLICLLGAAGAIALSMDYNVRERILPAESHVLVLFATSGMMVLAAARDLMIVFLGIELMSVAIYVLAGLNRRSEKSAEGSLKYFLLGAFATGFLLYGVALIYGATGSTNLVEIGERVVRGNFIGHPMMLVGTGLLLVGFGFKVAAAPFHMWAPDVYEGAPTPITAFMATAVKAAAFATFLRVWIEAMPGMGEAWFAPIWWLAALAMFLGNTVALAQRNMKRLLAYSSIAHTGYLLVAVATGTLGGSAAFLFYLVAYSLASFGAFAVVITVGREGDANNDLSDYEGLWSVRPWLAIAMSVFMLSLMGFPVFGGIGFFGKWYLLMAAIEAPRPLTTLAIVLVLTSVVSAGYYLNVVRVMFMKPRPEGARDPEPAGALTRGVVLATAVAILALGIMPTRVISWSRGSIPRPPHVQAAAVDAPR